MGLRNHQEARDGLNIGFNFFGAVEDSIIALVAVAGPVVCAVYAGFVDIPQNDRGESYGIIIRISRVIVILLDSKGNFAESVVEIKIDNPGSGAVAISLVCYNVGDEKVGSAVSCVADVRKADG